MKTDIVIAYCNIEERNVLYHAIMMNCTDCNITTYPAFQLFFHTNKLNDAMPSLLFAPLRTTIVSIDMMLRSLIPDRRKHIVVYYNQEDASVAEHLKEKFPQINLCSSELSELPAILDMISSPEASIITVHPPKLSPYIRMNRGKVLGEWLLTTDSIQKETLFNKISPQIHLHSALAYVRFIGIHSCSDISVVECIQSAIANRYNFEIIFLEENNALLLQLDVPLKLLSVVKHIFERIHDNLKNARFFSQITVCTFNGYEDLTKDWMALRQRSFQYFFSSNPQPVLYVNNVLYQPIVERVPFEGTLDNAISAMVSGAKKVFFEAFNRLNDEIGRYREISYLNEAVSRLNQTIDIIFSRFPCEKLSKPMLAPPEEFLSFPEFRVAWTAWAEQIFLIGLRENAFINPITYRCIEYITSCYGEEITLLDLEKHAHASGSYISFLFKRDIGIPFSEFLTQTRINHAKELLQNSNAKIWEISTACGFPDPKYFSRIFKKHTGLSPAQYRNERKAQLLKGSSV